MTGRPRVALALGSGGARGFAHVGALQVLAEHDLEVVGIAGSSMGALVGGLYAADRLDAYTEWALDLSQLDVVRLLDISLSAPGAIRAEKIVGRVRELLDGARIEDLAIPYTAVATDLGSRRPVWFQRGPVDVAIRASIAIPGFITPVMLNGRLLADGGILDPLPVAPTSAWGADLTIGISLSAGDPEEDPTGPDRESAEPRPVDEWMERFRRSASGLLDRDFVRSLSRRFGGADEADLADGAGAVDGAGEGPEVALPPVDGPALEPELLDVLPPEEVEGGAAGAAASPAVAPEAFPSGLSRFDVMNRSLDVMQTAIIRYRLAGYPPDVLVEVPKRACRTLDFHRAGEMIELGRTLTEAALRDAGVIGAAAEADTPDPSGPDAPDPDESPTPDDPA